MLLAEAAAAAALRMGVIMETGKGLGIELPLSDDDECPLDCLERAMLMMMLSSSKDWRWAGWLMCSC